MTTVAGNQTLEKTTANAIRVLDCAGRADVPVAVGADRPLMRELHVAADIHGETGLEGAELPPPSRAPEDGPRRGLAGGHASGGARPGDAGAHRAAHQHRPAVRALPGDRGADRADRAHGRIDRGGQRHTRRRVQHLGRPGGGPSRVLRRRRPDHGRSRRHPPGAAHARPPRGARDRRERPASSSPTSIASSCRSTGLATAGSARRCTMRWRSRTSSTGRCWRPRVARVAIDTGGELSRGRTNADVRRQTDWPPVHHVAVDIDAERFLALLVSGSAPSARRRRRRPSRAGERDPQRPALTTA